MRITSTSYDHETQAPTLIGIAMTPDELAFITKLVGGMSPADVEERHLPALDVVWEGGSRFFNRHYEGGVRGYLAGEGPK